MITDKEIEQLFSAIPVSEFSGIEADHVYAMAKVAYKKGVEDAADKCERRAALLRDQCEARLCKRDVLSLL